MKKITIGLVLIAIAGVVGISTFRRSPQAYRQRFMESGRRYYNGGEFEKASIQFRNAIQNDPNYADAYYELALSYLHLRRWPEAYHALRQADKFDPENPKVHMELAELYLTAHDFDDAEKEATFVLSRQANYAAALQVLGTLLVERNQKNKALEAFRKVVELRPKDPAAYTNLALVEIGSHDADNAEKHLRRAIEVNARYTLGYLNLASFYRLQGRMRESVQVLQEGVDRDPASIEACLSLATALFDEKKDDHAEAVLSGLRAHNSNMLDAALAIGDLYFQRRDLTRAESEYRRGLAAAPQNMDLEERIVEVLLDTMRFNEAATLDDKLLQRAPHNLTLHLAKGRILLAQGNREQAISELRRQTVEAPDSAQAHQFLGWALWQNGDVASGEGEMKQALNLDPNLLQALQTLARISLENGEFGAAADYATRALRIQPSDPTQHSIRGTAYLRVGQTEKAAQEILAAQSLDPANPTHHVELAAVYAAQGQKAGKERELKTAIELAPGSTDVLAQIVDLRAGIHDRAGALREVRQFISTHSRSGNAHRILAALYAEGKEYKAAHQELDLALQLEPKLFLAYLQLGSVCQAEQNLDCAVRNYEQALQVQPQYPLLLTLVGNLYIAKGNLDTAEAYFERALALDRDSPVAASNLAWALARQARNFQRALDLARQANRQLPNVDSIMDTLGWVEYAAGDTVAAASDLAECAKKNPNYAPCHYHLGMALLGSHKKLEAKRELSRALALNLKGDDAKQAEQIIAQGRLSAP